MDEQELKDLFGDAEQGHGGGEHVADAGEVTPGDGEGSGADDDDPTGAAHKTLPDPGEPTAAEVEDHRACGHVPFRSWCAECAESRGVGNFCLPAESS